MGRVADPIPDLYPTYTDLYPTVRKSPKIVQSRFCHANIFITSWKMELNVIVKAGNPSNALHGPYCIDFAHVQGIEAR